MSRHLLLAPPREEELGPSRNFTHEQRRTTGRAAAGILKKARLLLLHCMLVLVCIYVCRDGIGAFLRPSNCTADGRPAFVLPGGGAPRPVDDLRAQQASAPSDASHRAQGVHFKSSEHGAGRSPAAAAPFSISQSPASKESYNESHWNAIRNRECFVPYGSVEASPEICLAFVSRSKAAATDLYLDTLTLHLHVGSRRKLHSCRRRR